MSSSALAVEPDLLEKLQVFHADRQLAHLRFLREHVGSVRERVAGETHNGHVGIILVQLLQGGLLRLRVQQVVPDQDVPRP
eukprot:2848298-Pyramimonas_sp.AAC.1